MRQSHTGVTLAISIHHYHRPRRAGFSRNFRAALIFYRSNGVHALNGTTLPIPLLQHRPCRRTCAHPPRSGLSPPPVYAGPARCLSEPTAKYIIAGRETPNDVLALAMAVEGWQSPLTMERLAVYWVFRDREERRLAAGLPATEPGYIEEVMKRDDFWVYHRFESVHELSGCSNGLARVIISSDPLPQPLMESGTLHNALS